MIGCRYAYQILDKIQEYFKKIFKIKVKQLKTELKSIMKGGSSATEYLKKICKIVDSLAAVGHSLILDEHFDAIIDNLSEEYAMYISMISKSN
ncbi:hypothetical protein AHAS_Ahas11G0168000 [Arachis hypogaea]